MNRWPVLNLSLSPAMFPSTRRFVRWLVHQAEGGLNVVGQSVWTLFETARYLVRGKVSFAQFIQQANFIGLDTFGIALIMVVVSDMIIALQLADEMARQGAGTLVGALISIATLRELAPIMTCVSVIALAGAAYAAELATMKITQQVDALQTFHISPVRFLVVPRLLAGAIVVPMLTLLTATLGILAAMWVCTWMADITPTVYLESVWQQASYKDIFTMLLKASVFGILIVSISTSIGLSTRGGAKEVGEATTRAVVWAFVSTAIADYIITTLIYGAH